MKTLLKKLVICLLWLSGAAQAHTQITSVQPGAFAALASPATVELTLNEAVDLHFATLKVYPLPAGITDKLGLNRAAAALLKSALKSKNDADLRVNLAAPDSGQSSRIVVKLQPHLKAGPYALLWRILSDDGHIVTGYSVFVVK